MATRDSPDGFEVAWPALERRLRHVLFRKSVPPWLRDDIVQETALRLLRTWNAIDPERGPWPLTLTIANNLLWDETHRKSAREIVGPVPEEADTVDVARAGMARVELGRVMRALSRLSHNYQAVLLAEIGQSASYEGHPKAVNMLRMRARQRLSALVDRNASTLGFAIPAATGSPGSWWRRTTAWAQTHFSSSLQPLAPAAAGGLAALTVALAGVTYSGPGGGDQTPITRIENRDLVEASQPEALPTANEVHRTARVKERRARAVPAKESTETSPPNETSVEAGPARAKAGEREGYTYVAVCTGEDSPTGYDDGETSVTVGGGGQNDGDGSACSHKKEP
ncbi:MAG: RNA polymerase sigma factor [Actinomycetota bacterium]